MIKKIVYTLLFLNFLFCFWVPANCCGQINDEDKSEYRPSLHVLLTTIGRSTLLRMLNSLEPQLESCDYLTLVFDAKDQDGVFDDVLTVLTTFKCVCTVIMEERNLGYWGHGIRNKYNQLSGDFILHGDDDDVYLPGALARIRKEVCADFHALYVFPMVTPNGICIYGRPFVAGSIGTPMGAIPACYNSEARWGYFYGGDFMFYRGISEKVSQIIYVNFPIYKVRG